MDPILELARQHGLKVIEDCAQAQGATYKGRPVGSIGDVAAFSFCQDKIMTTCGEGGMLTTNDRRLWQMAWSFKDHGKNYDAMAGAQPSAAFRWVHDSIGTNWRMTEVQSAVGPRAAAPGPGDDCQAAPFCRAALPPLLGNRCPAGYGSTARRISTPLYKYYAFLRPERLRQGWNQLRIIEAINAEGIPCFAGSCSEIYLEKAFQNYVSRHPPEHARELGETSLMFLIHPTLSEGHARHLRRRGKGDGSGCRLRDGHARPR